MNKTYLCKLCGECLNDESYSLINLGTATRRPVRYCPSCFPEKLKKDKISTVCKCGKEVDISNYGEYFFSGRNLIHKECQEEYAPAAEAIEKTKKTSEETVEKTNQTIKKTPNSVKCFFCGDLVSNDVRVNWMNRWYHPGCLQLEKEKRENRSAICYICGASVPIKERVLDSGHSFHPKCFEEFQKRKNAKSVKCHMCGEQVLVSERVADEQGFWYHPNCLDLQLKREELLNYICMLYGLKKPGPVVFTQLKRFTQNLGYTYDGILKALKYHYEIQHGDKEKANEAIGIVPYIYDESMNYWNFIHTKQKQIIEDIEPTLNPPKIKISIQSDKPKRMKEKYNFDDLLNDPI